MWIILLVLMTNLLLTYNGKVIYLLISYICSLFLKIIKTWHLSISEEM